MHNDSNTSIIVWIKSITFPHRPKKKTMMNAAHTNKWRCPQLLYDATWNNFLSLQPGACFYLRSIAERNLRQHVAYCCGESWLRTMLPIWSVTLYEELSFHHQTLYDKMKTHERLVVSCYKALTHVTKLQSRLRRWLDSSGSGKGLMTGFCKYCIFILMRIISPKCLQVVIVQLRVQESVPPS